MPTEHNTSKHPL